MSNEKLRLSQFDSLVEEIKDISILSYYILYGCKVIWDKDKNFTASVSLPNKKQFVFKFGIQFWDSLSQAERLFLVLHECYHVFLEHFSRFEKIGRLENVAMDTALNHTLLRHYSFTRKNLPKITVIGCWNDTIVKGKTLLDSLSAEEYLEVLKQNKDSVSNSLDSIDEHNTIDKDDIDDFMDSLVESGKLSKEDLVKVEEEKSTIAKMAGEGSLPENEVIFNVKKKMPWSAYARKLVKSHYGDMLSESWLPDRRKLCFQKDLILPNDIDLDNLDKIKIILFMDTSGSCDTYKKDFIGFAKAMPTDLYEIIAYGFNTSVYPIDLKKPKYRSGGTSFRNIPGKLKEHTGKKYGFIFTDGQADTVNWLGLEDCLTFFMYERGSTNRYVPKGSKIEKLDNFE